MTNFIGYDEREVMKDTRMASTGTIIGSCPTVSENI